MSNVSQMLQILKSSVGMLTEKDNLQDFTSEDLKALCELVGSLGLPVDRALMALERCGLPVDLMEQAKNDPSIIRLISETKCEVSPVIDTILVERSLIKHSVAGVSGSSPSPIWCADR